MTRCKEPPVREAKEAIKELYGDLPTYYDFIYAFGMLKFWDLLWKKQKAIQRYSDYYHHRDTWTSSGSSDSSSSGGGASSIGKEA